MEATCQLIYMCNGSASPISKHKINISTLKELARWQKCAIWAPVTRQLPIYVCTALPGNSARDFDCRMRLSFSFLDFAVEQKYLCWCHHFDILTQLRFRTAMLAKVIVLHLPCTLVILLVYFSGFLPPPRVW